MENQRNNMRLSNECRCNIHLRESSHLAMTKNISSSGALINLHAPIPEIQVGEKCIMSFEKGILWRYDSEIVRVEIPCIAIKFLTPLTFPLLA